MTQTVLDFSRSKLIRKYLNPHNIQQKALIYRLIKETGEIRTEQLVFEGVKLGMARPDRVAYFLREEGLVETFMKAGNKTETWRLK